MQVVLNSPVPSCQHIVVRSFGIVLVAYVIPFRYSRAVSVVHYGCYLDNDLVIFDDFGLQPLDNNSRLALLQILEDCYQRKSVMVTSQLPVSKWYDYINEPTLADAIMDRLLANNAHRIELKGDSLRRKKQK